MDSHGAGAYTRRIARVADQRAEAFSALVEASLDSPGELPAERRRALAAGDRRGSSPAFAAYLDRVDRASYETSDEEVAGLVREVGEEAVFEATIAVAVGAALRGLEAALAAIGEER